ncbi:RNA 2',3'-cyclic phosphodiesterase [Neobacillus notoginsengisoli]|uniref:RNA 2',3'-cyclic phosphodiesterase n=1 Tax=Neobacillus notoginsengisoli TaxID=1578198 RepID=A0A417YUD0_9BACI|nr:RNA 2',3'-cyclic phosphodiesterase [Neobacillus notoginsengisoli]RHW40794.1 RNA 2',3'-cyclic phosphodiesterase [Neobacillus notoginsengisoli]
MSHYFFAAALPHETKLAMKEMMDKLKLDYPFRRWVHHQDLHITLAFLGAAPEDKRDLASTLVEEAVDGYESFPMEITGLGTFGRKAEPRVFWAGLSASEELKKLRDLVFHACEGAGFQLETRPFAPHVTLARNWKGERPFAGTGKTGRLVPGFTLDEVVLYRTNMDSVPKYEPVKEFRLR